jgi:hypothetical protein
MIGNALVVGCCNRCNLMAQYIGVPTFEQCFERHGRIGSRQPVIQLTLQCFELRHHIGPSFCTHRFSNRPTRSVIANERNTEPTSIRRTSLDRALVISSPPSHLLPRSSSTEIFADGFADKCNFGVCQWEEDETRKRLTWGFSGGPYRTRTCDPLRVMQVRYQLRQRPS